MNSKMENKFWVKWVNNFQMKYVISHLIWENKVKATVKELLPTKNKGQSLNNLEQNNNLPYCNDNENKEHKLSKKDWQPCLFQGEHLQLTEALYKRLIIKNKNNITTRTTEISGPRGTNQTSPTISFTIFFRKEGMQWGVYR